MSIDKKRLHCTVAALDTQIVFILIHLKYEHLLCKSGFELEFITKLLDCFHPGFDLFNAFKCVHFHRHTPCVCSSL